MNKFENDLTKGSVAKNLLRFSLPFIISNLVQSLYSVADLIIVSWFDGTVAVAGVNNGAQLTMIVTNMVFGLCVGATVLIGQYLGSGDREKLKKTVGTLFVTLFCAAAVMTPVMMIFRTPLMKLINVPEEALPEAGSYLFVTAIGIIFIFGYNALSAIMRGLGDSKRPLVFVSIAAVCNVLLDLLFVAVLKMGARGAAIATVASQALSMSLCIAYLVKNDFLFKFTKLRSYKTDGKSLLMLLKIGLPTMVQNTATSVSFLFITSIVNSFGMAAAAALGMVAKFNGFAIMPAIGISASISAMSAQNIGAGELGRARRTMFTGLAMAYGITGVVFALTQLFPSQIMSLFGNDPEVIAAGAEYISVFSFDYIIVPMFFCINGIFIGSGHTLISLFTNLTSALLARIPVSWYFGVHLGMGLRGVGLGAPTASAVAAVIAICFFLSGRWKKPVIVKGIRAAADSKAE